MATPPDDLPPAALRPAAADLDRGFFGHPRGLRILFFSEMWERFSFYGMRAILILYLTATIKEGGMGFDKATGGDILALYGSLVYLSGIPGGWIADKFLGLRRAVFIGGFLIMCGHICLAVPSHTSFFFGLGLIVLGTGLLKPNISAIVGKLYSKEDTRRDSGFTIFYMGINLGAFLAPLICGFLAEHTLFRDFLESIGLDRYSSWHFGFGMAAIGMGFGLVQYVLGGHLMGEAGLKPVPVANPEQAARNKKILVAILVGVFGVPLGIWALHAAGVGVTIHRLANAQGLLLILTVVGVFGGLFLMPHWTRDERRRLLVILLLWFGATVFWSIFEQAASTLSLFASDHTTGAPDHPTLLGIDFPASWYQAANSLFIILLAPVFAWIWVKMGARNPSSPAKFGIGMLLVMAGFLVMVPAAKIVEGGAQATGMFLMLLYLLHTCGELCLSPVGLSSMTKLAPASISGMVMGIWFLGSACGYYLAGRATALYSSMKMSDFFLVISGLPLVAAVIFFSLNGPIRRMLARTEAEKAAAGEDSSAAH
jgi:POT family proton-dependent oligopeptide transporter